MGYSFLGLVLFVCASSLVSVVAAQARQILPSIFHGRAGKGAAKLSRGQNRRRARRNQFYYPAPSPTEINDLVAETAGEYRVDPQLVQAIIQVESGYNTNAVSRKGARGLMQLIPKTARRFGAKNAFDPGQNIAAGVAYLSHLLQLFSGDVLLSVAAYNAGEHSVMRVNGIPPFPETQEYVRRVTTLYKPALLVSLVAPLVMKS
jgi:soluble lytic murein transglycosylase-like protein